MWRNCFLENRAIYKVILKNCFLENRAIYNIMWKNDFLENRAIYNIMWKNYGSAGQTTYENIKHVHCMLCTQGWIHALKICNTYCFFTATMVAWMRLNATLYVNCLSCLCVFSFFLYFYSYLIVYLFFSLLSFIFFLLNVCCYLPLESVNESKSLH
jgi:hypothetical protein